MKDTCAVIVTYNPVPLEVQSLVTRIADHVGLICIVDNGSRNIEVLRELPAKLIELGNNRGVATAQNIGIKAALDRDFKFVILFDQDSLPMPDMIPKLANAYQHLTTQGVRVAAVGPNYIERNCGIDHPTLDGMTERPLHRYARSYESIFRADMIISSGALIASDALRDVGLMLDELFIDHIDVEWCLRATRKHREGKKKRIETVASWKMYVACEATMGHSLGDGMKRFWFFRNRMLPIKSPSRYYYIVRNAVYLMAHNKDVPSAWVKTQIRMVIGTLVFAIMGFFPDQRGERVRLILRGIWDGIVGRLGPLQAPAQELMPEQITHARTL